MSYLPQGTLLNGGKLRIIRFLSKGGFGCTYEVEHVVLGTHYAVKEFFVSDFCNRDAATHHVTLATESKRELIEKLKRKFVDEAKSVATFDHPNIVHVTDIFEEYNTSYFVMNFIKGRSVAQIVDRDGAMPEERAVRIILQICDALEYVHNHNRLHLDIKPGNIMVDDHDHATLIDFGVSKQYDEVGGENTSTLVGFSKGYAPVEQQNADITKFLPATDIYSLGATLYKMLTGVTPPNASALASGDELPPLPGIISKPVARAVYAAMKLRKLDRPQSIADFRALLTPQTSDVPVHLADEPSNKTEFIQTNNKPQPPTPQPSKKEQQPPYEPPVPPEKKNTGMFIGIGLALVAAAILFILLLGSKSDHEDAVASPTDETEEVWEAPTEEVCEEAIEEGEADEIENVYEYNVTEEVETPRVQPSYSYNSNISNRPICTFAVNGVQFKMIPVDGSTFQMGSNDGFEDEKPVHNVALSDYYIGETEVTQELWEAVMGENPSDFKGRNRPVENVSYYDCIRFINKLNDLTGQEFRLPTEAEWEYAARGGKKSHGYKFSGSDNIDSVAWYNDNSGDETHPFGAKSSNELSIYDMSGNVWEWCSDWYGDYSSSSQSNPTGPASGSYRVIRGGGWGTSPTYCRVAYRRDYDPCFTNCGLGLRLALSSYR